MSEKYVWVVLFFPRKSCKLFPLLALWMPIAAVGTSFTMRLAAILISMICAHSAQYIANQSFVTCATLDIVKDSLYLALPYLWGSPTCGLIQTHHACCEHTGSGTETGGAGNTGIVDRSVRGAPRTAGAVDGFAI